MREECSIEGCLCHTSIQPVTDAVYGEKAHKRKAAVQYDPQGHTSPVWRRLALNELGNLAARYPKARRFAARRKDERASTTS